MIISLEGPNTICVAIAGAEAADIGTDAKYGSGITE